MLDQLAGAGCFRGEAVDPSTTEPHAVAAKAFDTSDLAAVREASIYIGYLFSQFSENVGDDPGIAKMVEGKYGLHRASQRF